MAAEEPIHSIDLQAESLGTCGEGVGEEVDPGTELFVLLTRNDIFYEVHGAADIELQMRAADFLAHPNTGLLIIGNEWSDEESGWKKREAIALVELTCGSMLRKDCNAHQQGEESFPHDRFGFVEKNIGNHVSTSNTIGV